MKQATSPVQYDPALYSHYRPGPVWEGNKSSLYARPKYSLESTVDLDTPWTADKKNDLCSFSCKTGELSATRQ